MGEAKRRKIFDPTWGKPKILYLTINGHQIKLESKVLTGSLILNSYDLDVELEIESTNDEADFLELMLDFCLPTILGQYNYEKTTYTIIFDLSNLVSRKIGLIKMYPAYWNFEKLQLREFTSIQVDLETFIDNYQIRDGIPVASTQMKDTPTNYMNQVERSTPAKHTRKAHKRRVAYGRGRVFRKWVDIPETIVNAR